MKLNIQPIINDRIIQDRKANSFLDIADKNQLWQSNIDELIHEVLGLKGDQPLNLSAIPSTEKICREMACYISNHSTNNSSKALYAFSSIFSEIHKEEWESFSIPTFASLCLRYPTAAAQRITPNEP